ncbi:tRNA lysidine(34) synthetase TilS [Oscillospiraceae bacterium WX1]
MLQKITAFADRYDMLPDSGTVLAAVSGGADSVCLLAALLALAPARGFSVTAAHFNHRLRGADADHDEQFVRDLCRKMNVHLLTDSADVYAYARANDLGIEAAARTLRYEFLENAAEKISAARIATAHTADDNAETILLNLTRGAGLRGLGGIPPVRGNIIRPMLTVERAAIISFLADHTLTYVEDATNALDIYNRNLLRHKVIPVLKAINPRFLGRASETAALARSDDAYLTSIADAFIEANVTDGSFEARALTALPEPVSSRVVRQLSGDALTSRHVAAVLALCRTASPAARLSLPTGTVRREYERVIFEKSQRPVTFEKIFLPIGWRVLIPELGLTVTCTESNAFKKINKSFTTFLFKTDKICGKIIVRPRETGDKIALFGRGGTKTLKKLFIEERIPLTRRQAIPVVCDDNGPLAVYGVGFDKRAAAHEGDRILEIKFEETAYEK